MRPKKFNCAPSLLLLAGLLVGLAGAPSARAAIKVGDKFPTLTDYQLEGALPADAADKVVLVDFWASWCGPCALSFPVMDELQKKYGPRGFIIIAVSVNEKKSDMDEFLKHHAVSFNVVRDARQKLVEQADISTMPSSFLLGRDGKVAFAHSGFRGSETRKQYAEEIETLLK